MIGGCLAALHPYWGQGLFGFFAVLFHRVFQFLTGQISLADTCIDEIQIIVLCLTGISCSIIGSFLVYRRMTMIANSISHTILVGVVVTYLLSCWFFGLQGGVLQITFTSLLFASVLTSLLTTASTNFFIRVLRVQRDASIGLVFTFLLAIGIILVTVFTRNAHISTELLLGNIDLLRSEDIFLPLYVAIGSAAVVLLAYRPLLITTFDKTFGLSLGISGRFYSQLIMLITSMSIICSFRVVGIALVLALLVLPPMIARFFTHHFHWVILGGAFVNLSAAILSVGLTRALYSMYGIPLSTTGMMVALLFSWYLLFMAFFPGKGLLWQRWYHKTISSRREVSQN